MSALDQTQEYSSAPDDSAVRRMVAMVRGALNEKGYDPVNQIVGYLISGDPTYITSHNDARGQITRLQRDEIIEFLLRQYFSKT